MYFVGPTAFNLLGIDRWVRNFDYIVYYDSWDGGHPRVFAPTNRPFIEFESSEEINNYLLRDPEVQEFIAARGRMTTARPKIAMVFFDAETEQICEELGYELILPPHKLRSHLDSKLVTTRLGNEAGVPSVPNVLTEVDSWDGPRPQVATQAGLGTDLVVQTAYGDSGKTTFFICLRVGLGRRFVTASPARPVKVMKRINNKAAAVEAVITRYGTVVGPFMTDLTGYPELTPYKGGWCGNDLFPEALSDAQREKAIDLVRRLGARLAQGELRRLLRGRRARRPRHRRGLPGRAQPAHLGHLLDDERDRGRLRRHAAVSLPSAGAHGRRLHPRRRGDQRALAPAGGG